MGLTPSSRGVKAMLKTNEVYEVASELLAGAVLDTEQVSVEDANFLSDILAHQDYTLRVCPDLGIVYAVPEHYIH